MLTDHVIIIINIVCIAFLLMMLLVLAAATRMKSGGGWASLIIVFTTLPAYIANFTRDFLPDYFVETFCFVASLNLLLMPTLYLFTRTQLDKSFHLTARSLLHLIPALISFAAAIGYFAPLTPEQMEAERISLKEGSEILPALINDVLVFSQLLVYYILIFRYIHKRKKELQDNYSDSGYLEITWIQRWHIMWCSLFIVVFIAYAINPRTDIWLIPILNVIGMAYLAYSVIRHSTAAYINRLPAVVDTVADNATAGDTAQRTSTSNLAEAMTTEQMKKICDKVTDYLQTSKRYKYPDLSLSTLALEVGVHHKKISTAINGYLHKNFFELINSMRVNEAKDLLRTLNTSDYTIESIYTQCGFQSRSSFFTTFKKFEGISPMQWLKQKSAKVAVGSAVE
jgi:AraC-like DNA-binding protein